jgi:ribosomal protein S18 acetylase RimI-like enzyme
VNTEPTSRDLVLRPLRESDADAVVALFHSAFGDQRTIDAQEVVSWFRNRELKPEWLRVAERDGHVVGYGDLDVNEDMVAVDVAAPGCWDVFLAWAERTAREKGIRRVRVFFPAGHELARVLTARGYRYWRSAYTMHADLGEEAPVVPDLPRGLDLRAYEERDAETLRRALDEVFADDPFHVQVTPSRFREFFLNARGFDPSLWLLAWDRGELAGFVLAFPERSGDENLGWIHSLGVRAPWRRKGLGEALLRTAFGRLHFVGLRRVGLGVDASNETGALRLYERAGMRVVQQGDNWVLRT